MLQIKPATCYLVLKPAYGQSERILERINESPWGRCLQGAVGARWIVVVVVVGVAGLTSRKALDSSITLLRTNGDASIGLGDQAMR